LGSFAPLKAQAAVRALPRKLNPSAAVASGFDFPVGKPNADGYNTTYGCWWLQRSGACAPGPHPGQDFNKDSGGNTDFGDPVYAVADGEVIFSDVGSGASWGNIILIEHRLPDGSMVWSQYAHLNDRYVFSGAVKKGDQIGTIGKGYNNIYSAHLHFEIRTQYRAADAWVSSSWSDDRVRESYANPTDFINSHRVLDTTAPAQTYVDGPSAGAIIRGILSVDGWAVDFETGISRIEIYLDGVLLGNAEYGRWREDLAGNVGYRWEGNSAAYADGPHTLLVKFFDNAENCTEVSRAITINNVYRVAWDGHNTPTTLAAGMTYSVPLQISNNGTFVWPAGGDHPVHVAPHWLDTAGNMMFFEGARTNLPNDIAINGQVNLNATVQTPDAPGSYILQWDVVQEGVVWFSQYGAPTLKVAIEIVVRSAASITWPTPPTITYGTALSAAHLNASANVAGTFTYTPALGTILSAGADQDIRADFTPTDPIHNAPASKTVKITVLKATPLVNWPTPPNITAGTPLSKTQLNATANIPGAFTYTPAIGTRLKAGRNQTLTAKFTPSDLNNYTIVSKSVKINVLGSMYLPSLRK
jgi:hypothetical protein